MARRSPVTHAPLSQASLSLPVAAGPGRGRAGDAGVLQIDGPRAAKPKIVKRDPDYLRHAIANHTHY